MWKTVTDRIHYILAGSTETPQIVLHEFAQSKDERVRQRVAENPVAAPRTLVLLLEDKAAAVRTSLTHNPILPGMFLDRLSEDQNPDVRYAIAESARTPIKLLEQLSTDENPYVAHRAEQTLNRVKSIKVLSHAA
jgi:HEAT repeat protein